jgi:WD40 repeat protein
VTDALRLVRIWGDDTGRVIGASPRLALTRDAAVVLAVTEDAFTRMDAATGKRVSVMPWAARPSLAPSAPIALDGLGERVIMGTQQGEVLLYRTGDGALERVQGRPRGPITHVALSDDGALAVDAAEDGRVRIWSTEGDAPPRTVRGRGPVSISPDGTRVVYWQAGLRVLDLDGDERVLSSPPNLRATRWSPDGALLWLVGEGRGVACWHPVSNVAIARFERAPTTDMIACDREGALVMLDRKGAVHRFTPDGNITTRESSVDESVHDGVLSPDATRAAWLRHGSTLCVRGLDTGRDVHHHGEHAGNITALAISSDGSLAATAGSDRLVRVWNVSSGDTLWSLEGPESTVLDVCFSPDGTSLYAACAGSAARVWSLADGAELDPLPVTDVGALRVSPDGARLVARGRESRATSIVDLTRGASTKVVCDEAFEHRGATFVGHGDEVLVVLSLDRTFALRFEARTGLAVLPSTATAQGAIAEAGRVGVGIPRYKPVAFSPDGARMASETRVRGKINVLDARTLRGVASLDREGRSVDVLPLSLGATTLVVPTRDGVEVWDHTTEQLVGDYDLRPTGEHPVAVVLSSREEVLLVATSLARVHHLAIVRTRTT